MKEWGTDLLADPSYFKAMVTVRLPEGLVPPDRPGTASSPPEYTFSHASYIENILHHEYKVEVKSRK